MFGNKLLRTHIITKNLVTSAKNKFKLKKIKALAKNNQNKNVKAKFFKNSKHKRVPIVTPEQRKKKIKARDRWTILKIFQNRQLYKREFFYKPLTFRTNLLTPKYAESIFKKYKRVFKIRNIKNLILCYNVNNIAVRLIYAGTEPQSQLVAKQRTLRLRTLKKLLLISKQKNSKKFKILRTPHNIFLPHKRSIDLVKKKFRVRILPYKYKHRKWIQPPIWKKLTQKSKNKHLLRQNLRRYIYTAKTFYIAKKKLHYYIARILPQKHIPRRVKFWTIRRCWRKMGKLSRYFFKTRKQFYTNCRNMAIKITYYKKKLQANVILKKDKRLPSFSQLWLRKVLNSLKKTKKKRITSLLKINQKRFIALNSEKNILFETALKNFNLKRFTKIKSTCADVNFAVITRDRWATSIRSVKVADTTVDATAFCRFTSFRNIMAGSTQRTPVTKYKNPALFSNFSPTKAYWHIIKY